METATTVDARTMLRKVPEVTLYFWIIKVLATTVGETGADLMSEKLHLGLSGTTLVMSGFLAAVLVWQFRLRRYVPGVYWLAVVLISIVGTLFSDNLVDHLGVPLETTTILFAVCLAVTFAVWFAIERTLSIHSIYTTRREAFYWLAILFTFALGTAAGDWISEGINLGYWKSAVLFAGAIAVVAFAYYVLKANEVLTFWIAYILTRPLGASMGDYMSQSHHAGGLGLGTVTTSVIFLATISIVVVYLAVSRVDQAENTQRRHAIANS